MALAFGAAHAANLGMNDWLAPRDVVDYSAKMETLEKRANSGSDTVNLFLDVQDDDYEFAASVVAACKEHTVYALQCTEGSSNPSTCGPDSPKVTFTENASEYRISSATKTRTAGVDVTVTLIETCKLGGTTAATCTVTYGGEAKGQKTFVTSESTFTDVASWRVDVAITAGNEKLANPTGKCSAASEINTRAVALWGLVGAIGAIGVLAL
ncbi:hypothetical protein HD806DRAFT_531542 [Xylariaceae sp. AK1471]|nr:hypothetical protein HD806DRAFT_531542 [Xylariaceae sp. AK1471]